MLPEKCRGLSSSVPGDPDLQIVVGADPDLHSTALVAVFWSLSRGFLGIQGAEVLRVPPCDKGRSAVRRMVGVLCSAADAWGSPDALAVESQQVYRGKAYRADDLLCLAHVSGAILGTLAGNTTHVYLPTPADWKGQVSKAIHHARVLSRLDIAYDMKGTGGGRYGVPRMGWGDFKPADYMHLVDALGLAIYAGERLSASARVRPGQ